MEGNPTSRATAQQRADRIRAFRDELEQVDREGGLALSESQRRALRDYHDDLLATLRRQFDVDVTHGQQQMSWGMRIASTIGALALGAAVYFFFHRFWGLMTTPMQVGVLAAGPLAALALMEWFSRRERTLYFTGLMGVLATATFVLNISMLGTIFNIKPSENAFLLWGAFALVVAYAHGLRLILSFGILSLIAYLSLTMGTWSSVYWLSLGERPENYLLAGAVAFVAPLALAHQRHDTFPAVYRALGCLPVFLAVLFLSNWGDGSYLSMTAEVVEILYQVVCFGLAAAAIWLGIRCGWRETTNMGMTFLVVFLYVKFFDWWWELMPKYLFFLILGLVAVGLLYLLRGFRATAQEA